MSQPTSQPTHPIGPIAVRVILAEVLVVLALWWVGAHFGS
jgi:hypothetical protein